MFVDATIGKREETENLAGRVVQGDVCRFP